MFWRTLIFDHFLRRKIECFYFLSKKLLRLYKNCIKIKNASWQILQNGIFFFFLWMTEKKNLLWFSCADNNFPRFRALGELLLVALHLVIPFVSVSQLWFLKIEWFHLCRIRNTVVGATTNHNLAIKESWLYSPLKLQFCHNIVYLWR